MRIADIPAFTPSNDDLELPEDTPTTNPAALALALHDLARIADQEATRYRNSRDHEIRHLYAAGMSGRQIATALGLSHKQVYKILDLREAD